MPVLHRITRRIGRRGASLSFLGLLDLMIAWSIWALPAAVRASPSYAWLSKVGPLNLWAAIWAVVGVVCLAHVARRSDTVAFVAAIALKCWWGVLVTVGWLSGAIPYGGISAAIWIAFAAFVGVLAGWDEPTRTGD